MDTRSARRTIGEAARFVVEELSARGVDVNASSRFGQYSRRLMQNAYKGPWSTEDPEGFIEGLSAIRDVEEVAMILDEFPRTASVSLSNLIQDSIPPRLDKSTPGRDRQLELFVGAICKRGGMRVCTDVEPDLLCEARPVWLALAVKRLRSVDKFEANLKDAAAQIRKSSMTFGVACLDVSLAMNPELAVVLTRRDAPAVAFDLRERLSRFLDSQTSVLSQVWERFPESLGMLCLDHTFTHDDSGWYQNRFSMWAPSSRNNRHRTRIANEFRRRWNLGSPNLNDMENGNPRTGNFSGPPIDQVMPLRRRQ